MAEGGVDPVDDRHGGSEVLGQRHVGGVHRASGQQVEGDVGPPEPVDGLLGVTDQKQGSRYRGEAIEFSIGCGIGIGQQQGQLELHGVGVLKFIKQDVPVALVQRGPDRRSHGGIGQQVVGDDQQVVEGQGARSTAFVGRPEGGVDQLGEDSIEHAAGRRSHDAVPEIAGLVGERPDGVLVVTPVTLPARTADVE